MDFIVMRRPKGKSTKLFNVTSKNNRLQSWFWFPACVPSRFTVEFVLQLIKHLEPQVFVFLKLCCSFLEGKASLPECAQHRGIQSPCLQTNLTQHTIFREELFSSSQSLVAVTSLVTMALVWEVGEGKTDLDNHWPPQFTPTGFCRISSLKRKMPVFKQNQVCERAVM